jgi:hypothetical protein
MASLAVVSPSGIIWNVNRHCRTLQSILEKRANIPWSDIEKMLIHYGAELSEGEGSRVRIALNGVRAVFHRPHPQKETDRGAVAAMRRFLLEADVDGGDDDV